MKEGHGFGVIGLLVLATALAMLLTIGIPISVSKEGVELKDWLGFAGNVLGAFTALGAAVIAWRAVQAQIAAQRDAILLDITVREEDRLEAELHAMNVCIDISLHVIEAARDSAGPNSLVASLKKIGLSPEEMQVRNFIQSKINGPIPSTLLEAYVFSFANITQLAQIARHAVDTDGARDAQTQLDAAARDLGRLFDEQMAKVDEIRVVTLPRYRERIESGLRALLYDAP